MPLTSRRQQDTPPMNPFGAAELSVTDSFYKPRAANRLPAGQGEKKLPRAQPAKICCVILAATLPVLLFASLPSFLSLGTRDAQNQLSFISFGLSICYSARFLCGLPKAALPVNIAPLCELASRTHDHNPSGMLGPALPSSTTATSLPTPAPVNVQDNFASILKGASIIEEFTSQTYRLPPSTILADITYKLTGFMTHYPSITRPTILLDEYAVDGECWEFSGADGQVGVQLSEKISVSHVSLKYIPAGQLSPYAASQAPQDISIWGLIQDAVALQVIPAEIPVHKTDYFLQNGSRLPSFINSSSLFVRLTKFRYDAFSTPWQQFSIPSSLAQVSNVQTIIAVFETNKGASTTCVYTIGIHGVPT